MRFDDYVLLEMSQRHSGVPILQKQQHKQKIIILQIQIIQLLLLTAAGTNINPEEH